jgi:hypothetical protein
MEGQSTGTVAAPASRLGRLAHFTARYRWPVIAAWLVLTVSVPRRSSGCRTP